MKFKTRALTLACLAALGMAQSAQAIEVAGKLLEVYGNVYPQFQNSSYTDSVATGVMSSNMTSGKAAAGTSTFKAAPIDKTQLNWVNSYIGWKGEKEFGDVTVGYDLQGTLAKNVEAGTSLFADTRDAFVYVEHKTMGTVTIGQIDTIYKQYGDRLRMLGVSSSNINSTSTIVSGVGWKPNSAATTAAGTSSFNTRIGGQIIYETPSMGGVKAGFSYRPDPSKTLTQDASLMAAGLKWSDSKYFIGAGYERHNDYRAFSGTGAVEAATTIYNANPRSQDTVLRGSVGYTDGPLKLAADLSSLEYTEAAATVGKFSGYKTTAWQVSGEYSLSANWVVAGNYASNAAGSCSLLGGATCSTFGQGGTLLSLGGMYKFDKNIGIFAIYTLNSANESATFASSAIGGKATNMAMGIQVKF